jgi:hypothetical protein
MKKYILVMICPLIFGMASASHIVGGEIFYDYLGNNTYQITLKLYRNCNTSCLGCAPYDNPEYVTIFDSAGNVFNQLPMPEPANIPYLPGSLNPCISFSSECVQEADYTAQVTLPASTGGYTIVYQRCCRNMDIVNLEANQGSTFTAEVPGSSLAVGNNSARFINVPAEYVCLNTSISINYAATDPDADSLVYNLCNPYLGADANCVDPSPNGNEPGCPTVPSVPPYNSALYSTPYADTNFTNSPPTSGDFSIDPHTGLLTGVPNTLGVFDITVCVGEYRNGHLLNTLRRDFQLTVSPCNQPLAVLPQQQVECGLTVSFNNSSYTGDPADSVSYLWNFGVPGTDTDFSTSPAPTYIYPDTGSYVVQLIANNSVNGQSCSDTAFTTVKIQQPPACETGLLNIADPASNIRVYPNPATNSTTLYYNPFTGQAVLNIYNTLGQLVKQQAIVSSANRADIKTDKLQDGVYTYSLVINDRVVKRDKFIVVR